MTYSAMNAAQRLVVVASAVFVCSLQGCPGELTAISTWHEPTDILAEGAIAEAVVVIDDQEQLHASEVVLFEEDGEDGEDDNGTAIGECESDGESGGERDWGGFTTLVDAIASDRESFVVFGGLKVVLEVEHDYEEGGDDNDWDCEDEETGDGEPDGLRICDLEPQMWVEVFGFTEDDETFRATTIETADAEEATILGTLQNLEDDSFALLGLPISFDDDTEIDHTDADICE